MNAVKKYNKLVRDRIPEIIAADGKRCTVETLSDEEYLLLLDHKLDEELAEYQESKSLEELADPWLDDGRAGAGTRRKSRRTRWIREKDLAKGSM